MTEVNEDTSELLFFDTFSHETNADVNLDLVQFPKPVFITQVRIIPLGARVQADFPGGVRLGATNPSKFNIDFFVNDLGMPGASTFENLGHLQYNQNDQIHLECNRDKIPTDGLVLRGWYSTITLAVYGILTNAISENIGSPPQLLAPPPPPPPTSDALEIMETTSCGSIINVEDHNHNGSTNPTANINITKNVEMQDWPIPSNESNSISPTLILLHKTTRDSSTDIQFPSCDPNVYDEVLTSSASASLTATTNIGTHRKRGAKEIKSHYHCESQRIVDNSSINRGLLHSENNDERKYIGRSAKTDGVRTNHDRDWDRERDRDRDWSHSPEINYTSSRRSRRKHKSGERLSRTEMDLDESLHKWTPTVTTIESPQRLRLSDYSLDHQTENFHRINDSLSGVETVPSVKSTERVVSAIVKEDTRSSLEKIASDIKSPMQLTTSVSATSTLPVLEQYEPILSDDEIIGDDDNDFKEDILMEDVKAMLTTSASTATTTITAATVTTLSLPTLSDSIDNMELKIQEAVSNAKSLIKETNFNEQKLQRFERDLEEYYAKDVENLKVILKKFCVQTRCENADDFSDATIIERENFVYLSEQLINQLTFINQTFVRRNYVLREMCECKKRLRLLYQIIYIGLDFKLACLQNQPVFKIRHIKTGVKLMTLLAPSEELFEYLLKVQEYDPMRILLNLVQQQNMALSIKLLIFRAIYTIFDTKSALKHCLVTDYNTYCIILDLLQKTRLSRTKYSLQAIIKKLHLYEALSCFRKTCSELFYYTTFQQLQEVSLESQILLDSFLQQILDALTKNSLLYQQPKRFLPVSHKFEVITDPTAEWSFSNTLKSYMKLNTLAESLLLLISNAELLSLLLQQRILDVLQALLRCPIGLDYLIDDSLQTTQLIFFILMSLKDATICNEKENNKENNSEDIQNNYKEEMDIVVKTIKMEVNEEKSEKENIAIKAAVGKCENKINIDTDSIDVETIIDESECNKSTVNKITVENVKSEAASIKTELLPLEPKNPISSSIISSQVSTEAKTTFSSRLLSTTGNLNSESILDTFNENVKRSSLKNVPQQKTEIQNNNDHKIASYCHRLSLEMAYKIQTRYHLDAIDYYVNIFSERDEKMTATNTLLMELDKVCNHLHEIYKQLCLPECRQYTIDVISWNSRIQLFIDLINKEQQRKQVHHTTINGEEHRKNLILYYAIDILYNFISYSEQVDYLIENGQQLLQLAKNDESFETIISLKLQKIFVYLKPLEVTNIFSYDDITGLVELLQRSLFYVTEFPGDLIMSLRILHYLTIDQMAKETSITIPFLIPCATSSTNTSIAKFQQCSYMKELKHRYVTLQLYSADGIQILIEILEKICMHYEQPGLYSAELITMNDGYHCFQIILYTVQIIRQMLRFAIKCRDIDYKDLTPIDYLIRTYYLLHYCPQQSPASHLVEASKSEIIQTFLAYTQPNNELDEEALYRSPWTLMLREVLKNIDGPSTFVPGLIILSELLPLPLPIPVRIMNTKCENSMLNNEKLKMEAKQFIRERKLWSAHLHPQSQQIVRLLEIIAFTNSELLQKLLIRVCLQLADLAPNMTLLVSKTICDLLSNEWNLINNLNKQQAIKLSTNLLVLLKLYAHLSSYASIKISTLSILSDKLWDILQSLLSLKIIAPKLSENDTEQSPSSTGTFITFSNSSNNYRLMEQCQLFVHRIIESFLDTNISFVKNLHYQQEQQQSFNETNLALNLASALPPRELLPRIAEAILDNLLQAEVQNEIFILATRNLIMFTKHNITFYHLSNLLRERHLEFRQWMLKVIEFNEKSPIYHSSIESVVLLLHSLTQITDFEIEQQKQQQIPLRTLKLNLIYLIGEYNFDDNCNVIQRINNIINNNRDEISTTLHKYVQELNKLCRSYDFNVMNKTTVLPQQQYHDTSMNQLRSSSLSIENNAIEKTVVNKNDIHSVIDNHICAQNNEPFLPQTESIITQYEQRPIFINYHCNQDERKLTMDYWLLNVMSISNSNVSMGNNFTSTSACHKSDKTNYDTENLEIIYERIPCDLTLLIQNHLPTDTAQSLLTDCKRVLHLSVSPQSNRERTPTAPCFRTRRVEVEASTGRIDKKIYVSSVRGGRAYVRTPSSRSDLFRSRPPNTSRPPSLHVDDFLALETCGVQPTGPTGYNKIPALMRGGRISSGGILRSIRGGSGIRGSSMGSLSTSYRSKVKALRTSSPTTWNEINSSSSSSTHFISGLESHYLPSPYSNRSRNRTGRIRPYLR